MRMGVQCLVVALLAGLPSNGLAQSAPTRQPGASTPAQDEQIRTGASLHDQGKFAEAIAVYQRVLAENADNTMALYELAYSLLEQKDYARVLEVAARGTAYRSEQLPMFYDLMGSAHDLMGDPKQAVAAYAAGLAVVPDAAMLYYNKGVTELESLKDPAAARASFQKAVAIEPLQPAAHLMLGQVLQDNGYPVPAFFAFAMSLILEPGGPQALRSYGFMRTVLRGGLSNDPGQNQMQTAGGMRPPQRSRPAKIDEGDYAVVEGQLAMSHQRLLQQLDNGTPELRALVQQVEGLLTLLASRDLSKDQASFTGRHYLPFFVEMKRRGFVEPFVYWSIQRAPVEGARQWVQANQPRVKEFLAWAQTYEWPAR